MNIQKEREAFETWAENNGYHIEKKDGNYVVSSTINCWLAWQAKAQAVPNWIDLNERMPEQGQKVLIFRPHAHEKPHEDPSFKIATYCGNDIWINSHFEHEITHWMPLINPLEKNS